MSEILVRAEKISRTYTQGNSSVVALASATCQVVSGDRIALIGPSGSGKSTLLYLMGGLDQPTSGVLNWPALGRCESLRPAKIAFVFQMPSLLPPLSVIENVELPLLLNNHSPHLARITAIEMLEQLGLNNLTNKLPEELSAGQAQRVGIARALAIRPQLILADEPTGQLDEHTAKLVLDILLESLKGSSTALVIATHDPKVVERLDTLWFMQYGALKYDYSTLA